MSYYEHDGDCDDYCEECFEEGYDYGYEEGRRSSRSSSGGSGGGNSGGCYVATAVYGSYDCPEVWTLRRFRDNYLKNSAAGRAFIRFYYAVSPKLVAKCGHYHAFQAPVRAILNRFVDKLKKAGYQDTPYKD